MAKKSFISAAGAAGVAASFLSIPVEEFESNKKQEEVAIKKEVKKEKVEKIKAEPKVVEVKEKTMPKKKVEIKDIKEEFEKAKRADNVGRNGKPKIMDTNIDNKIRRCSYTLENDVIRKVTNEAETNNITAYDVFKKAIVKIDGVLENIEAVDKENSTNKTYVITNEMYKNIKMKAVENDIDASNILNSALKKYFNM